MDRRKNAEELLKWKKLLDAEENKVLHLEKKALKVWDQKEKDQSTAKQIPSKKEETEPKMSSKNGTTKGMAVKEVYFFYLIHRINTWQIEDIFLSFSQKVGYDV